MSIPYTLTYKMNLYFVKCPPRNQLWSNPPALSKTEEDAIKEAINQ